MSDRWFIARKRLWVGALTVLALVVGMFLMLYFFDLVIELGRNIPQENILYDYMIGVVWATFLGVSILAWPLPFRDRRALIVVWLIKSVITLVFMLFYEANYETLDAYSYFLGSKQKDALFLAEIGLGAGTQNISALAWLHYQIIPDSYHAMKVSFSMLGLLAIYIFYRAYVIFIQHEKIRAFYLLALFPSALFWSSILGKEPVILVGTAFICYGIVGWHRLRRLHYIIILALGFAVTVYVREWMGLILLSSVIIYILSVLRAGWASKLFFVFVISIFLLFLTSFLGSMNIESMSGLIQTTNSLSQGWATGGSAQNIMEFSSVSDAVAFVPWGMFTALFRPLPGEIMNPFGLLAGLENLILLCLFLLAIKRTGWKEAAQPLIIWAISLVVIWAVIYGFISYQNLGTAVRFKLQILPLLVGLLLHLARRRSRALMPIRICGTPQMLNKGVS